jgi:hypothetical protein
MQIPKRAVVAIAALLAVLAGGGAVIVTITSDDERVAPATITVPVDGLDAGKKPDRVVEVPAAAVKQAAPTIEDNLNAPPAATSADELAAANQAAAKIAQTQQPLPTAGATAGFAGCRTSFVRNQSSRRGVRPQLQVLHYTVSPNRPGWSDVDAVVALFNRSSSQASSHFVIDTEGHCAYIVPIEQKSWTEAAGNPFSVSYEIIATGKEPQYLTAPGLNKLRQVMLEVAKRTGIPMRAGAVSGCTPTRTGIVQHKDFGICGGGHVDIAPFDARKVIADVTAGAGCSRACDLRKRNAATHAELKRRRCAPPERTRSDRCRFLHRRHAALHAAATREHVKL